MVEIPCQDCAGTGVVKGEPCRGCAGVGHTTTQVWPPAVLEAWPTRPAIILDPFAGSGTTLMVAETLGRWWVGIDICADYEAQIKARTAQRSLMESLETSS
ncbi:MAG: DNA methyltransferase [Armatimonadota bacterium]